MKYTTLSVLALGTVLPLCARALPSSLGKRDGGKPTGSLIHYHIARNNALTNSRLDPEVLNFALTLEHLEAAFYKQGLERFNEDAFTKGGFEPWVHGRFQQIAAHEYSHVEFLKAALAGAHTEAVQPCTYDL